jgi:hypothetical protein
MSDEDWREEADVLIIMVLITVVEIVRVAQVCVTGLRWIPG